MIPINFLRLITFLSAFLLFLLEFIVAKSLLPHYGGTYMVWGACIVFFQAILLLGYLYVHFMIQRFGIQKFLIIHCATLFVPLLIFPGQPLSFSSANLEVSLAFDVFVRLLVTIGPVFFLISTVSIVAQSWVGQSQLPQRANPYVLYSISNAGSFAALLSYPFFFEMFFTISEQTQFWRMSYFLLIGLHIVGYFLIRVSDEKPKQEIEKQKIPRRQFCQWFIMGAAGVIVFLSVNNLITSALAPAPLVWIFPLGIYLLAFVLNFKEKIWCPSWITEKIHITIGLAMLHFFFIQQQTFPVVLNFIFLCCFLFILCMYCQNCLIKSKPRQQYHLTLFYAITSLGSFFGGFFTMWIVPLVSVNLLEYLVGLLAVSLGLLYYSEKKLMERNSVRVIVYLLFGLILYPILVFRYQLIPLALAIVIVVIIFFQLSKARAAVSLSLACILIVATAIEPLWTRKNNQYRVRNYYGSYKVFDTKQVRYLMHGQTMHGLQFLDKDLEHIKLGYYGESSPLGYIFNSGKFDIKNIGAIGLGIGTVAGYLDGHQTMDFYEIDYEVERIARKYFTHLENAKGHINVILGDGRVALEQSTKKYDLIIVDAFNGDSVPSHLLTKEALQVYFSRLTEGGLILFHITNKYIDIMPILATTAFDLGVHVNFAKFDGIKLNYPTAWIAIYKDDKNYKKLVLNKKWNKIMAPKDKYFRPWTDEYSSIIIYTTFDNLFGPLKNFNFLRM